MGCSVFLPFLVIILFCALLLYIWTSKEESYKFVDKMQSAKLYALYIPDRKTYISEQVKYLGLDVELVRGPNKSDISLEDSVETGVVNKKWYDTTVNNEISYNNSLMNGGATELSAGCIACYLGHVDILTRFLESGKTYGVVFEDDIIIGDKRKGAKIRTLIKNILSDVPKDTDIIYLDYCWESCDKIKERYNDILVKPIRPLCTDAYIVTRKGAKKINRMAPISNPFDVELSNKIFTGDIIAYSVDPSKVLIRQNHLFDSNTDKNRFSKQVLCNPISSARLRWIKSQLHGS